MLQCGQDDNHRQGQANHMTLAVRDISTLQLMHGTTVLGTLTKTDVDMPWVQCTFVPTPAFATIQPLFEAEQQALTDQNDVLWEQLYEQIDALGLRLVNQDKGQSIGQFLLHIDGDQAWFRY
jgi:hypothetical protein